MTDSGIIVIHYGTKQYSLTNGPAGQQLIATLESRSKTGGFVAFDHLNGRSAIHVGPGIHIAIDFVDPAETLVYT